MSGGAAPGRREGVLFPILLPIIVVIIVVAAIVSLGSVLLAAASVDKTNAIVVALVFTLAIMVICSFVYVLTEQRQQAN